MAGARTRSRVRLHEGAIEVVTAVPEAQWEVVRLGELRMPGVFQRDRELRASNDSVELHPGIGAKIIGYAGQHSAGEQPLLASRQVEISKLVPIRKVRIVPSVRNGGSNSFVASLTRSTELLIRLKVAANGSHRAIDRPLCNATHQPRTHEDAYDEYTRVLEILP